MNASSVLFCVYEAIIAPRIRDLWISVDTQPGELTLLSPFPAPHRPLRPPTDISGLGCPLEKPSATYRYPGRGLVTYSVPRTQRPASGPNRFPLSARVHRKPVRDRGRRIGGGFGAGDKFCSPRPSHAWPHLRMGPGFRRDSEIRGGAA